MAKELRKKGEAKLPIVDDVEAFLDKLTNSVEGFGEIIVTYLQGVIAWLKKHKKLAILILFVVVAINWAKSVPAEGEDEDY